MNLKKMTQKVNTKSVGNFLRIFPTFIFIAVTVFKLNAATKYEIPDFAFPKQVVQTSRTDLDKDLNEGNSLMALRYAMNLVVAENQLTDDGPERNINILDSVKGKVSGIYKNLLDLLEAEILNQTYSLSSVSYDARKLDIGDVSEDPLEWSGEIYRQKILQKIDSATLDLKDLPAMPLNDVSILLTDIKEAEKIGMTVNDFIVFKSADILSGFTKSNSLIIPFYSAENKGGIDNEIEKKQEELLQFLIHSSRETNNVVNTLAICRYLNFLPDDKREQYLLQSIKDNRGKEGEGLLLYEEWQRYQKDKKDTYRKMKRWKSEYPTGYGIEKINYALSILCQEEIETKFPSLILPGEPVSGNVTVSNLEKGYVLIYKLNDQDVTIFEEVIPKKFNPSSKPVAILEIGEPGEVPYSYSKEIELPSLSPGLYAVVPSKEKYLKKDSNQGTENLHYSTIRVTNIAILSACDRSDAESAKIYVVDARNQKPIENAWVYYYKGDTKTPSGRLKTNAEGWVKMPIGYYRVKAVKGENVAFKEAGFSYYPEESVTSMHTTILTDLSVYRPGGIVKFAVLGWKSDKENLSIVKDCDVEISIRDANYMEVGKTILRLDSAGRAWGELAIPEGRLLGHYTLNARYPDHPSQGSSTAGFKVEEYKQPAFLVTLEKTESKDEMLEFKGFAATYSGMPVINGKVRINVGYLPWRWGFGDNVSSYEETLTTDSEGMFTVSLPLGNLKGTIYETGRYKVTAEVTSQAGETEVSSPLIFFLGSGYEIRPVIAGKTEVKGDSISFHTPVFDMAGVPVVRKVDYRILTSDSTLLLTGSYNSPVLTIPAMTVPSGKYKLELKTEGSKWISTETVVWRKNDLFALFSTPLWVPETEYSYKKDENQINIRLGSYWPEWLLYTISDGYGIIESKWISPVTEIQGGCPLADLKIEIPEGNPTLFVTVSGLHDFESSTEVIKIVPCESLEKMNVTAESFRTDITTGEEEEWIFKFKVDDRASQFVNVFAVMSDKALNSINDFRWNLNISKPGVFPRYSLNPQIANHTYSFRIFTKLDNKGLKYGEIVPGFESYGYSLSGDGLRTGGVILYRSMATKNMMNDSVEMMEAEAIYEESTEVPHTALQPKEEEQLRPVEMPSLFFMPDLKANEDGEVAIRFKVPDFNTTWQLQIAGYNEKLQNASIVLDAVASKPIMVKSNLPRYLRTGDKAEISATLYNNTEEIKSVGGKLEIINIYDGSILTSQDYSAENLSPFSARVISIPFDVPMNVSVIALRAYAIGESHKDGEEGYIVILPSSAPVTESKTFYATTDEERIELKIPKLNKNANVTLKYCDNPLWEVLLSLPVFKENENNSSLSIAGSLFATLLSKEIVDNNSEIREGLKEIFASSDTTIRISNLEKDKELKIINLEATPWINDASNETMRIMSLCQYLDSPKTESRIESGIEALKKLQMADGGFSWLPDMKSTPFITAEIIAITGYLKQCGALPVELDEMTRKAVRYYDKYLEETVNKNKSKFPVNLATDYFYSRNMTGVALPAAMKRIEMECCDSIAAKWRHWDEGMKAKGALVLMNNPSGESTVMTIASSLKEFLDKNFPLEQEALLLELFQKIEPRSETVEKIKEKIYLQKETRDFGNRNQNVGLIYSMTKGLNSEDVKRSCPVIFVNDKKINLPENGNLTGNYTIQLDPAEVSGKTLTIQREGNLPAWGGIVSQYLRPIKDIKSSAVENLSIEKIILKQEAEGNFKEVSAIEKGDKVKIVLNINCRKDMEYIVVSDSRSASLQPDSKVSGWIFIDGLGAYQEIGESATNFFIENIPAGKYVLSYDCHVEREGTYSLGLAEIQCLYSPAQVAHSAGCLVKISSPTIE